MSKNRADRAVRTEYGRYQRMAADGVEVVVDGAPLVARSVEPLHGREVRVVLSDGSIVERDLRPLLVGSTFEAVADDDALFRQVGVEGGAIVWPNGAVIGPDRLIFGPPPATASVSSAR